MPIFTERLNFATIFDFRDLKKAHFEHHFQPQIFQKSMSPNYWKHPCRDPAFNETKGITVPLAPTDLLKVFF